MRSFSKKLVLQVTLNVAEMDMVYSQYGLLCLVAFLDKASPPPNLDPLMLRATVTLHEIVRERLITPKRSSQLSNNQQFQTNIEVSPNPSLLVLFAHTCTSFKAYHFPVVSKAGRSAVILWVSTQCLHANHGFKYLYN